MRNCHGLEAATGASAREATFVCDAKGLAQLYQHAVGGDFFAMQRTGEFELSAALAGDARLADALRRDVAFLRRRGLVDYSLLMLKHPAAPAAAEVVLAPFGVTLRTPFGYEFSLAIIDICSTLETWPKGEERGVKFMLPCGKFADYADQFEGLLELLADRAFGRVCVDARARAAAAYAAAAESATASTKAVARGATAACARRRAPSRTASRAC